MGVHRGVRRVPLREAAELLGVSKDALRQRIRRGTIRSDKGEDGRVYAYVDASTHDVHAAPGPQSEVATIEVQVLRERIEDLREQNEDLRRDRDEWREQARMTDRLLAGLVERLPPQIEAPRDEPGGDLTVTDEPASSQPRSDTPGSQEPAQPRSWWQRLFGE